MTYVPLYYAGIGSRETPLHIRDIMTSLARNHYRNNRWLRSGGALGADRAFELGHDIERDDWKGTEFPNLKQIFYAEDATEEAMKLSSKYHPNWKACKPYAKMLHGRNAMIILGADLKTPVSFVQCWTKDKGPSGGTGQAIRIALDHGIRVEYL